ncbi:MAG: DEAD/DEAH box helicase [Clostridia bacterium]|nr:DEAD/DEAH box helicase [Clostridia bacterium]
MFDAQKTEQETKQNIADFILDWKKIKDPEIREALRKLWTSDTPQTGSLLSDLLIENNFPYVMSNPPATLESLDKEFFSALVEHLQFKNQVLVDNKLPLLHCGRHFFNDNPNLQNAFLSVLASNTFSSNTPLFAHQEKALRTAMNGKDFILSSGTGSGKTESFLLPTLARLFNESDEERSKPGIRVLIIYPMNALINSQVSRLQSLIGVQDPKREPIRFALYNSKLEESKNRQNIYINEVPEFSSWPDLQTIDREELRTNPPHILVTNYSMLEYALIRPKDYCLFFPDRQKLHTIILDEAHTYIGAMAAEIAMLIRRVLLAFNKQSQEVQFFATSATIGDPEKDGGYLLRKFAADLFNKELESIEYIDGSRVKPLTLDHGNKPVPNPLLLAIFQSLDNLGKVSDDECLKGIKQHLPSLASESFSEALYQIISRNENLVKLVNSLTKGPKTLTQFTEQAGLPRSLAYNLIRYLATMKAADTSKPLVKLRLHSVAEAPDGVFYCPSCKAFYHSFHEHCPNSECLDKPLYELVVCKDCGEAYLCSLTSEEGKNERIDWRSKTRTLNLQIHKFDGSPAKRDQCFRCGKDPKENQSEELEGDITQEFDSFVIDPEIALYQQVFFSAISVSIDLIQKIAIDSLFANLEPHQNNSEENWMPGKGRRLLTFTDNRQKAAKLPPALDWLHEIYLGNRIIYDSINDALKPHLQTEQEFTNSFPPAGKAWLSFQPTITELIFSKLNELPVKTEESITRVLSDLVSQQPNAFQFFETYTQTQFLKELIKSQISEASLSFQDAQESIAMNGDLREMAGVFEKIEIGESWENLDYRRKIGYWILLRSLGILSKSQYLPENSGLFKLEFPISSSFIGQLEQHPGLASYTPEQIKTLVSGLINHMRANGGIDARWPQTMDDPLSDAATYILQNALVNQYYVLERGDIPKNAPSNVKNWFNLETKGSTAPINIIRKALGDEDLPVKTCQDLLAELWPLMVITMPELFKLHDNFQNAYTLCLDTARIAETPTMYRCPICQRTSPHHINGYCISSGCFGKVEILPENQVKDLYGYKRTLSFPKLGMRTVEHTAQLDLSELTKNEKLFIDGQINVLSSSTTMELGIDIGGITSIFLANCPPGPSNYLQRAGRAGRRYDRLAYVLTSARKVPLDHYFFLHPDLFFTRKPHDPYVSLNSEKIVRRHLNSFILRSFFDYFAKLEPATENAFAHINNPLASYGTVKDFFGFENIPWFPNPIIDYLLEWLQSAPEIEGLDSLLNGTDMGIGFNRLSYLVDLQDFFQEENTQIHIYEQEMRQEINNPANNQRRQDVLKYYLNTLFSTDIVSFLTDLSILPKYGFPTDVVSLNTVNYRSSVNIPITERTVNRFKLQRSSEIAITEYAPGAQIFVGKKLITSRGISFGSFMGREGFSSTSSLEQRNFVECTTCNHFYIVSPTADQMACPVCGTPAYRKAPTDVESLEGKTNHIRYAYLPKGFRVDYQEPQPYAPNKIDKDALATAFYADLQTQPEAFTQIIPDILRIATTQSATFYALNKGPGQKGYAVCLSCGKSVPETKFKANDFTEHTRLYSDKKCTNDNPTHSKTLMAEFVTDAIQIRFAKKSYAIEHSEVFMQTFARCLQLAAAKFLGIDARELRFLVQAYYDPTSNTWNNQEIVLYDNVPGGAGYSEMIVNMFRNQDFYHLLLETTECPEECSEACPACLITFEKEDAGHQKYNRHLVREFLERMEIKGFFSTYLGKVKPNKGDRTVNDIVGDASLLLMGKSTGRMNLYINALPKDEFSIVEGKFGSLLEMAKRGIEITLVFPSSLIQKSHATIQQNLAYGISYAGEKLNLRIRNTITQEELAAVVDDGKSRFAYEIYLDDSQEVTPFESYPSIRRLIGEEYQFPQKLSQLKLDTGKKGIRNLRISFKQVEQVSQVRLWHYLCEHFELDANKPIASVWYSDRYLLQIAENLCFLMLLEDMPLQEGAQIHLAVNSERSSYSDRAFSSRQQQRKFFSAQARLNPRNKGTLTMYCTTTCSQASDPGQIHHRDLQVRYVDGSSASFSFDSGMSFFSPFIDWNWDKSKEHFLDMMLKMERSLNKKPRFNESLIFYYPEDSTEETLESHFKEAIEHHRIKLEE